MCPALAFMLITLTSMMARGKDVAGMSMGLGEGNSQVGRNVIAGIAK